MKSPPLPPYSGRGKEVKAGRVWLDSAACLVTQGRERGRLHRHCELSAYRQPSNFLPTPFPKKMLISNVTGLQSGPFPAWHCRLALGSPTLPRGNWREGWAGGDWDLHPPLTITCLNEHRNQTTLRGSGTWAQTPEMNSA